MNETTTNVEKARETARRVLDEARFEYRCRRCGTVKADTCTGWDNAIYYMMNAVHEVPLPPRCRIGVSLEMHGIHHCEDGGLGVSDFIGAERRKDA